MPKSRRNAFIRIFKNKDKFFKAYDFFKINTFLYRSLSSEKSKKGLVNESRRYERYSSNNGIKS